MEEKNDKHGNYTRFFVMVSISTLLMFFLMYFHTYSFDHIWFSETRVYMALIMGSSMTIVMLTFMLGMYKARKKNAAIYAVSAVLLFASVWMVRSQVTVSGVDYMEGMIPHHSIAILTSERAKIKDPRVKELANKIISAQEREIKEMEWLIEDIKRNGRAESQEEANTRPVPDFSSQ